MTLSEFHYIFPSFSYRLILSFVKNPFLLIFESMLKVETYFGWRISTSWTRCCGIANTSGSSPLAWRTRGKTSYWVFANLNPSFSMTCTRHGREKCKVSLKKCVFGKTHWYLPQCITENKQYWLTFVNCTLAGSPRIDPSGILCPA